MDPSLYVILDRAAARGRDLEEILDATIAWRLPHDSSSGEKEWPTGRLLPLAERLRDRCRRTGVTFIVNDRVDLAVAVEADGVHLGQDDLPRAPPGPSCAQAWCWAARPHSVAQARQAQADGADYIAVGSMFPTQTKPDFELVGPELLRAVRPETKAPLVGIGGITRANVAQVIRAGADGVAVISAVCGASDPAAATREFVAAIRAERDLTRRASL